MSKVYHERRSFMNALQDTMEAAGWVGVNTITYREGFKSEAPIVPPTLAITFVRPSGKSFQMGTGGTLYNRIIQVDCYMEQEQRVLEVIDTVMDFMDLVPIAITDPSNNVMGSLICQDTDSIDSEIFPPILNDPKLIRWRGIIRGIYEAHYYE